MTNSPTRPYGAPDGPDYPMGLIDGKIRTMTVEEARRKIAERDADEFVDSLDEKEV